jgi:nucleotide-binding universal stress UspA family protein
MKNIEKILVAVDFTENETDLLEHMKRLIDNRSVTIYVLHVVEELQHQIYYHEIPAVWGDFRDEVEKSSQKRVQKYTKALGAYYTDVTPIIQFGHLPESILEVGKEKDVDLIIVGTHGRKGIDHFVHSNVAEKVVRRAKRPVLTFYINK